ncbi:hypothetical protein [Fastidiosibacter lacustris]|uniref:hypothetical protein n=1 Tax=Fastidiosibacter lacustris TaxID=2056695 RepID=UPI000E3498FA|nr:hypothetical protein [Fastidiosibacter lacustris]
MFKKLAVFFSLLMVALSGFQLAEAKRFGGGSSHGYSRSAPTQTHNNATHTNATQKQTGMGTFGKILTALGLGALFAWLFSAHGMTGLLIVIALIALVVFIMRRKAMQHQINHKSNSNFQYQQPSSLHSVANAFTQHENVTTQSAMSSNTIQNGQLPDGTPETVFNHQALNLFNQLQSLNNKTGLEKIKSYITEDLYKSVINDIQSNEELAEFKDVSCKVIDCDRQGDQWIASVMFVGQVKENSSGDWQNFEEIWHFTREDGEHLWQVAGVQQF